MTGYIIRRLGQAVIVILGVILLTFLLAHFIPGGEARAVLGVKATPTDHRAVQPAQRAGPADLGPVLAVHRRASCCTSTWATPTSTTRASSQVIMERLPKTLTLVLASTLLALVIAIPLGILQVVRRNKPIDYVGHRGVVLLLRHARLPGRHAADHLLLLRPEVVPVVAAHGRLGVGGVHRTAGVRPADRHAVRDQHRLVQPVHAVVHDGGDGRRLHPHGPGQGGGQPAGPLRPCPAQRADPDPDPPRTVAAGDRQRRAHRGERVQLPGHGTPDGAGRVQRGHPGRARRPHS